MIAENAPGARTPGRAWALSSPALLMVLALALLPSAMLLVQAIRTPDGTGFTLSHFEDLTSSRLAMQSFWRTLRIAVTVTLLTVLGGYPLALVIAGARPRMSALIIAIVIFPLTVSVVVRAFGWIVILGPSGIVNQALMNLGVIVQPLTLVRNEIGIIVGETQLLLPYMVLSLLAVLNRSDPHLQEAAQSLGANPLRTFIHVTLPVTVPGLLSGLLMVFSLAITAFATPMILGGPKAPMLTTLLYRYVFSTYDWAAAAAVGIVLSAMAIAFVTLQRAVGRAWMRSHD